MSKFDGMKLTAEEIDMLNRDSLITDHMQDITASEASKAVATAMMDLFVEVEDEPSDDDVIPKDDIDAMFD